MASLAREPQEKVAVRDQWVQRCADALLTFTELTTGHLQQIARGRNDTLVDDIVFLPTRTMEIWRRVSHRSGQTTRNRLRHNCCPHRLLVAVKAAAGHPCVRLAK